MRDTDVYAVFVIANVVSVVFVVMLVVAFVLIVVFCIAFDADVVFVAGLCLFMFILSLQNCNNFEMIFKKLLF